VAARILARLVRQSRGFIRKGARLLGYNMIVVANRL
jgi:hypothetical protein